MPRKWHVLRSVKDEAIEDAGRKEDLGNFETKEEAEKSLAEAQRKHPDSIFEIEECSHPEHR